MCGAVAYIINSIWETTYDPSSLVLILAAASTPTLAADLKGPAPPRPGAPAAIAAPMSEAKDIKMLSRCVTNQPGCAGLFHTSTANYYMSCTVFFGNGAQ